MKNDDLSIPEFDSCWQACSQFRLQGIKDADSLADIIKKWPEYKKPTGYRLINKDFAVVFGNRPGILSRWPEQALKLKHFLLEENHLRDKSMRTLLDAIEDADVTNDNAAVKLMWCLHAFLIPTQKQVRKSSDGKKRAHKKLSYL